MYFIFTSKDLLSNSDVCFLSLYFPKTHFFEKNVSYWICPPFWRFVFRSSLSGLGRSAEKKKVETGKNRRGFRRFFVVIPRNELLN